MQISVTRELLIPETGLTQTIETIGKGISAEHAFEDARTKLDAIEKRFYLVERYRSNLQLIKRHEGGELLNETELEAAKKQIAEFEAAEIEFLAKKSEKNSDEPGFEMLAVLPIVMALIKNIFDDGVKKKPAKKTAAKKAAPKKATAKKASGKK